MKGEAFITAEEVGAYLGRGDLSDDPAAEAAVVAACDACRTTADQLFDYTEDDEIMLDGPGSDALILPQVPVIAVTSILDSDGDEVDDTTWILSTSAGILVRLGGVWTKGRLNFTVTYNHGFEDDPSGEHGSGFPEDLRMVAKSMAGRIYMQGPTVFESLGSRSVRYDGPAMDFTNTEKAILRKYKQTM